MRPGWADGLTTKPRFKHLRWRFRRPSRRRYLRTCACRFLWLWCNATWLYLACIAVISGFSEPHVTVEPTIIVLCVTMVLTAENFETNQVISILTAVLGAIAAFLALAERSEVEVGALNLGLWAIVGLVIGLSAFSVLMLILMCPFDARRMRRRKRRTRKPSAP